jgi:hypothetical protein
MDKPIDIKSKLLEIQARPVGLPYDIKPPEAASLIRERDLLLKIAIALEVQNQYLLKKIETPDSLEEEMVVSPIKKDGDSEEMIKKKQASAET